MSQFVNKQNAAAQLNLSPSTLKRYRMEGTWIEGVHWVKLNSRCIRYNLELIKDWLHNRHDPLKHEQAIEIYRAKLLSAQKYVRR
jgi:tRNA(His) 5'-end guanylyltransferase